MDRSRGIALLKWSAAALMLAAIVWLRLRLEERGLWLDLSLALIAVATTLRASRKASAPRSRRAWRWQVAMPALWALAAIVVIVDGTTVVSGVLRLASVAAACAAWWLTSRAMTVWARTRLIIDGGLAAGTLLVVGWSPIFSHTWSMASATEVGVLTIAMPLVSVWVAVLVAGMAATDMRRGARAMPTLYALTLVALAVSDVRWAHGETPVWSAAWFLMILGALTYRGTSQRTDASSARWEFVLAPYVISAPAVVAYVVMSARGPISTAVIGAGLGMVALLLARQHLALLENRSLVSRLARTEKLLRHQATHDHLTGLAGRALLWGRLEAATQASERVAVVFVDLDDFKEVNDAYGHAAGDDVLVDTARRLTAIAAEWGDDALAVRMSGDEFSLLLVGDAADAAEVVAGNVVARVSEPFTIADDLVRVGASVGVAVSRAGAMGPSALLRAADVAMYRVKHSGKGGYSVAAS